MPNLSRERAAPCAMGGSGSLSALTAGGELRCSAGQLAAQLQPADQLASSAGQLSWPPELASSAGQLSWLAEPIK